MIPNAWRTSTSCAGGIENSYKSCDKSYEQLQPWTTSNRHSVRILLWYIPFILYNLWMLARFLTGRRTGIVGGRPPLPLHHFVSYMLAVLTVEAKSGRPTRHAPAMPEAPYDLINAAAGPRSAQFVVRMCGHAIPCCATGRTAGCIV